MPIAPCVRFTTTTSLLVIFTAIISATAQGIAKKPFRQKAATQKETTNDSTARYKIDSQLLEAITQYKNGNKANKTTREPVSVGADSKGNLSVDISAVVSDSLLHKIVSLGGKIIHPSKEYRTVRAIINLRVVETLAARKDVSFIQPAVQAYNNAVPALLL